MPTCKGRKLRPVQGWQRRVGGRCAAVLPCSQPLLTPTFPFSMYLMATSRPVVRSRISIASP